MHMRYHLVKYIEQNFELIQLLVSTPLESRQMTLQQYVTKMSVGDTCGYEVMLLILSKMFKVPLLVIHCDMLWLSRNVVDGKRGGPIFGTSSTGGVRAPRNLLRRHPKTPLLTRPK